MKRDYSAFTSNTNVVPIFFFNDYIFIANMRSTCFPGNTLMWSIPENKVQVAGCLQTRPVGALFQTRGIWVKNHTTVIVWSRTKNNHSTLLTVISVAYGRENKISREVHDRFRRYCLWSGLCNWHSPTQSWPYMQIRIWITEGMYGWCDSCVKIGMGVYKFGNDWPRQCQASISDEWKWQK